MSSYRELLERLLPARRFGMVLGTERMRALLDRLGAPDRRMGAVVHVGGTNGKGSTVAMLAALCDGPVGAYTSPHLTSLRERIAIDGVPIAEDAIVAAAEAVRAAGGDELTFFEQLTAIACVAFAAVGPRVTILEVGLGGRLDATNAVADPAVAVVTGVAMDHEAILGDTLGAIAAEKAGIFKAGQRIVIGASGEPAAVPILVEAARAVSEHVVVVEAGAEVAVALAGAHQQANAAAALAALDQLEALGVAAPIDAAERAARLARVVHPGRFEVTPDGVILDGAHNPHGAAALARALGDRKPTCILGVSADKDVPGIVRALAPAVARFVATRYQQERALAPAPLAECIYNETEDVPVSTAPDLAEALALARTWPSPILVCGSLFLVGEARTLLLGAPTDPIVLSDPNSRPGASTNGDR